MLVECVVVAAVVIATTIDEIPPPQHFDTLPSMNRTLSQWMHEQEPAKQTAKPEHQQGRKLPLAFWAMSLVLGPLHCSWVTWFSSKIDDHLLESHAPQQNYKNPQRRWGALAWWSVVQKATAGGLHETTGCSTSRLSSPVVCLAVVVQGLKPVPAMYARRPLNLNVH